MENNKLEELYNIYKLKNKKYIEIKNLGDCIYDELLNEINKDKILELNKKLDNIENLEDKYKADKIKAYNDYINQKYIVKEQEYIEKYKIVFENKEIRFSKKYPDDLKNIKSIKMLYKEKKEVRERALYFKENNKTVKNFYYDNGDIKDIITYIDDKFASWKIRRRFNSYTINGWIYNSDYYISISNGLEKYLNVVISKDFKSTRYNLNLENTIWELTQDSIELIKKVLGYLNKSNDTLDKELRKFIDNKY